MLRKQGGWSAVFVFAMLLVPAIIVARSGGPPGGVTGGFGEGNCTQCHRTNPVNTGSGSVTITPPASYVAGSYYPVRVSVRHPDQRRWGFELSARTEAGQQAGTLVVGSDGYTLLAQETNGIQYVSHSLLGTRIGTTGGADFDFFWRAPATATGPIVLHAAGNAANGNDVNTGDFIYTTSANVPAAPSTGTAPTLPANSTVNGASFAPAPATLAPGSIAALFGTNLTAGPTTLSSVFGSNGRLVSDLVGVRVTVNGAAAPIFYATAEQLGVQIPADITGTTANIQVTTAGQASVSRTINLDVAAPGIFTTNSQGTGQGIIVNATTGMMAAASGSVPGLTTQPARPGEDITIFATGLGQTSPAVPTGEKPSGLTRTVATPTVTIDGQPAEVTFSGLSSCCVGLNQINVKVPAAARASNTVPVVLTISGKQSNSVTIAVAN